MGILIGYEIRQKIKDQHLSVTEFAKRINCSRRNVYSIFDKSSIDIALLQRIGEVLNYNFFELFVTSNQNHSFEDSDSDMDYFKEIIRKQKEELVVLKKENKMLAEITQLLREKLEKQR